MVLYTGFCDHFQFFSNHMHIVNSDVFFCSRMKEHEAGTFLKFVIPYADHKHMYNSSFHCYFVGLRIPLRLAGAWRHPK